MVFWLVEVPLLFCPEEDGALFLSSLVIPLPAKINFFLIWGRYILKLWSSFLAQKPKCLCPRWGSNSSETELQQLCCTVFSPYVSSPFLAQNAIFIHAALTVHVQIFHCPHIQRCCYLYLKKLFLLQILAVATCLCGIKFSTAHNNIKVMWDEVFLQTMLPTVLSGLP